MPPSAWWPYSAGPGCVSCIGIMYIICLLIFVREWETCFQSRSCPLTCTLCMLVFESCRTEKHWLHLSQHVCLRVMEQAEAARPVLSRRFAFKTLCPLCEHKDLCSVWNCVCVCNPDNNMSCVKMLLPPRMSFKVPKHILWICVAARI